MARFTVGTGIDNYITSLDKLLADEETCLGRAIYEGAKIVTDRVRREIEALPERHEIQGYKAVSGLTDVQKQGLLEGLGIARMRRDGGFINVKVGMDGYNGKITQKYPRGQPNAMVARMLESGSAWHIRRPFITRAVNGSRRAAEAAMKKQLDEEIKKRMK